MNNTANYGHIELHIEDLLRKKGISKNQICKDKNSYSPYGLRTDTVRLSYGHRRTPTDSVLSCIVMYCNAMLCFELLCICFELKCFDLFNFCFES